MQKLVYTAVVAIAGIAAWLVLAKPDAAQLKRLGVPDVIISATTGGKENPPVGGAVLAGGDTIRVASFNIQVFGESKIAKPDVMGVITRVVRNFDVVAIQEVRAKSPAILPQFVDLLNAEGARFDYVIGPRLGRTVSKEQYAFVFNTDRVEIDRSAMYTVDDPDDVLHREPLVACFRARGPAPEEAFTFTLINIHTDPDETDTELNALDDVFRAVQNDGRREDDIILLGDLNVDDRHLGELGQVAYIRPTFAGVTSNTRGTKLYDNIVFDTRATTEFTGRCGVYNLMQEFNLSVDQALTVSDHLPIWAEFETREGGVPGRFAQREGAEKR